MMFLCECIIGEFITEICFSTNGAGIWAVYHLDGVYKSVGFHDLFRFFGD